MSRSPRVLIGSLAILIMLSGHAAGQESPSSPASSDTTVAASSVSADHIPGMKSGTTAFLYSFLGTSVPAILAGLEVWEGSSDSEVPGAIFAAALVVGPSLGHFYAARPGRALAGIGIRALAGAGVGAAILAESDEGDENSFETLGIVCAVVGTAVLAYDIVDAPHSAHVHNEQVSKGRVDVGLIPTRDGVGFGLRAGLAF